jgi:hypothetical protein
VHKRQKVAIHITAPKVTFYFWVLHPVARILSRLLEEPSLATTLQYVYFVFYIVVAAKIYKI